MGGTLSTEVVSIGLEGVGIVEIDKKTFPLLLPEHYDATFCAYVLFLPDRGTTPWLRTTRKDANSAAVRLTVIRRLIRHSPGRQALHPKAARTNPG